MKGLQRLMALWIVSKIPCPERYERFTSRKFVRSVTFLRPSVENLTLESGGNAHSVRCSVLMRGYQASDSFH